MGRQIVYCEDCGNSLRETDFERGKARTIDNRPFCIECRPFQAEPTGRKGSTGKVPLAQAPSRKNSTGAIPIIPGPARRPGARAKQSNPLPIIAGVGGLVFLVLLFMITSGGNHRTDPRPEPPPPPLVEIPTPRPAPTPVPPPPRETPPPPRETPPPPPVRRDPPGATSKPSDPLAAPSASEKLDAFIAQIKTMIQTDKTFERVDEIINMFSAAAKGAGPRAAEVDKLKSDYLGTLDEPLRRSLTWRDWKITSGVGGNEGNQLLESHNGRSCVYVTHPLNRTTPATLERSVPVAPGKKTTLSFWVSCHEKGDFELRVFADGEQLLKEMVGPAGSGWRQKTVDLTRFAGRQIALRLENFPNDWSFEHGYWSDLVILSE